MKQNKPIRIAFDASPLLVNKTGIAYYVERLVTALSETYGDQVELHGFYYNFLGRRSTEHFPQAPNITYHGVHFIPSKVIYQLRRWGIEIPFELLCPTTVDFIIFDNFLGYPSLRRTPSAPVVHDLTYLDLPQYVSAKNGSDLRRFVPRQVKRSAFVVTVSEFSKTRINTAYAAPLGDILVTPIPPVPTEPTSAEEHTATLKKLGINRPFIAFVGTIEPRKNVPNLIEAFKALPADLREKYSLVIAGRIGWNCDAEIAAFAAAKAEGLPVVHLGYISDHERNALYRGAELFVTASHYEGFGMPVLEAMNNGTPCAVSDIPVFREVAQTAARYFNQADSSSIAATITSILRSTPAERKQMGEEGRQRAAGYTWPVVASDLMNQVKKHLKT